MAPKLKRRTPRTSVPKYKMVLRGNLQDVRGFSGEVQLLIDSLVRSRIAGTIVARIISDESAESFEGKVQGKMAKDKMVLSYSVGSGKRAIGFKYEGDIVKLDKGIGVSGVYRVSPSSRNTFLRAGTMNLLESSAVPQASENAPGAGEVGVKQ